MSKTRKLLVVGTLVAVEVLICATILVALAVGWSALPPARVFYFATTRATETIEESFSTDGPATLDLTNTYGDVQIVAGDGDRFVVKAIKETWGQGEREAQAKLQALAVKMTMDGNTLRVEVEDPDERTVYLLVGVSRSNRVRFEVTTPRQAAVVAHTRNGHITLKGTTGDARLTSRYGSISVEDVAGSVTVETHNGNVMVHRSGGEQAAADLQSRYGSISVEDVAGSIKANTHNGNVTVHRAGSKQAAMNLQSRYGSIVAREVTAGELTLDSHNGRLTLENVIVDGDLGLNTQYGKIDLDRVQARSLKGQSHNGAITLDDIQLTGKLDLSTHYDAVRVARTEASEYRIETHNGAIDLDGGHGSLWLHSNYGNITVKDARDATLDLNTRNGKVTFAGSLSATGEHQVESHYGSIVLRLPSDMAVDLDASTDYGRIRCEFDVTVQSKPDDKKSRSGDDLRGTINGGGAGLRIKTRNGDIAIETTE